MGVGIATQKVGGGPEESDFAVLRLDGTVPEIGQRLMSAFQRGCWGFVSSHSQSCF